MRELTLYLKPRHQEVVGLLCFGGCAQVEPVKELGIRLAIVKTRARAVLQALAQLAR